MTPLGQLLIDHRWLSPEIVRRALDHQRLVGGRFSTCLLELGLLPEEMILRALTEQHGVPGADRAALREIAPDVLASVPRKMAISGQLIPFGRHGSRLSVAIRDLRDLGAQDELAFVTSHRIVPHVALDVRLLEALETHFGVPLDNRHRKLVERLDKNPTTKPVVVPLDLERRRPGGAAGPVPAAAEVAAHIQPETVRVAPRSSEPLETQSGMPLAPSTEAPEPEPEADATASLHALEQTLAKATERDEIGEALLDYLADVGGFTRILFLMLRGNEIAGWLGRGDGIDRATLDELSVPLEQPSIFLNLRQGAAFHLGPLADLPAHHTFAALWGGDLPKEAIALPVRIRNRLIAAIYADRGPRGLGRVELPTYQRAALKAGIAFEMFILRKKLLTA